METTIDILKRYFDRKALTAMSRNTQVLPFITISRQAGAADIKFLKDLLNALNEYDAGKTKEWNMFGKESLGIIIQDKSITKSIDDFLPEKKIPELQSMLEQLFGVHSSIQKIVKETSHSILKIASMGETVLIGRGSNHITKHLPGGMHIRFISSIEHRISNIMQSFEGKPEGQNPKCARKYIEDEDKNKKDYVKKNFNEDIENPSYYSMVINLSRMSEEDAIDIICHHIVGLRRKLNR